MLETLLKALLVHIRELLYYTVLAVVGSSLAVIFLQEFLEIYYY